MRLNLLHEMPRRFTQDHQPKKREMRLNISQRIAARKQKTNGNCQCIIPKIFCERVLTRLMGELQFMHLDMIKPPV
jgi:hypothetical protein